MVKPPKCDAPHNPIYPICPICEVKNVVPPCYTSIYKVEKEVSPLKKGSKMNTYSIIQTPLNKWAVIKPLDEVNPNSWSNTWFPKWLPFNHTHMGIFNTLDEAVVRMNTLRESEAI